MYRKYDKVKFISHNGEEKSGKLMGFEDGKWWVQVKEAFSYQLPIENRGNIVGWVPMNTNNIDYYIPVTSILGIITEENDAAA